MIERGKIRREVKPLTREIKTENKKTRLITDRPGFDFLKSAFFKGFYRSSTGVQSRFFSPI